MSRIKLPVRRYNLVLLFVSLSLSIGAKGSNFIGEYPISEIQDRIESMSDHFDFRLNADVQKYLKEYIDGYRPGSERLIGRSLYYFPLIEHKIKEKSLPQEIKFLAMVESGLDPQARSKVGAVGMWQFMRPTAKMYGLHIDATVDERKDPEKSTEAALNYLSDLHTRFGDWTLALAAYNCGPGNVSKAMRRSGGNDYWSIRSYLPRETRMYVPKMIAISYLMNYYLDHDLEPEFPEQLFMKTRSAVIHKTISFNEISELTDIDVAVIKWYNPEYISNYIPNSREGKLLTLPSEAMYRFIDAKEIPEALYPDYLQDLENERKVASVKLERIEMLEIKGIEKLDGLLTQSNIKVKVDIIQKELEEKMTLDKTPVQKLQKRQKFVTVKASPDSENNSKDRKITFRKESMAFRFE